MFDIDPGDKSLGALWRDVLNFLGDREITPADYLPMCDAVLPKWSHHPGYLGGAWDWLTKHRAEIETKVAQNGIGWRLWTERREDLRRFAEASAGRPVTDDELRSWWIDGAYGEFALWNATRYDVGARRSRKLLTLLRLTEDEMRVLGGWPQPVARDARRYWDVRWLHSHLDWADNLAFLRQLARKTWPADVDRRVRWTPDELEWVNGRYHDQEPFLMAPSEDATSIDPFELEIWNDEQPLGFGAGPLTEIEIVFMRATVIDFADDILERSKRGSARGSLKCVECGKFVGRRALGYGQLYCSERCKKRVAKRRYRGRVAVKRAGPALIPLPPYEPVYLRKAREKGDHA